MDGLCVCVCVFVCLLLGGETAMRERMYGLETRKRRGGVFMDLHFLGFLGQGEIALFSSCCGFVNFQCRFFWRERERRGTEGRRRREKSVDQL